MSENPKGFRRWYGVTSLGLFIFSQILSIIKDVFNICPIFISGGTGCGPLELCPMTPNQGYSLCDVVFNVVTMIFIAGSLVFLILSLLFWKSQHLISKIIAVSSLISMIILIIILSIF